MTKSINVDGWFPSSDDVAEIDGYLEDRWLIRHVFDDGTHLELLEKVGRKRWKAFLSVVKTKNEKLVTDAMADFDIHALHVSQWRRSYILDQMAIAYAWMKRTGVDGDVMDVGCQNGVLLTYLASRFPNNFLGVDPSRKSVAFAKSQNAGLSNLSFEVGALPTTLDRKFDLILCNDVLHHLKDADQYAAVSSIFSSLNDGMAAIISTQTFEDHSWWDAIQPAMANHGISLVSAGRVGGCIHGGSGAWPAKWASTGVGVFQKTGSTQQVDPDELRKRVDFHWSNFFAPYANDPATAWSQKTLAYEGSRRSS